MSRSAARSGRSCTKCRATRNHREDLDAPLDEQYGPAHDIELTPHGLLARLSGEQRLKANSLHSQECRPGHGPRRRGACPGRSDRSFSSGGRTVARARAAVASRSGSSRTTLFSRAVRRFWRSRARACPPTCGEVIRMSTIQQFFKEHGISGVRGHHSRHGRRGAREGDAARRSSPRKKACACRRASSCRPSPARLSR